MRPASQNPYPIWDQNGSVKIIKNHTYGSTPWDSREQPRFFLICNTQETMHSCAPLNHLTKTALFHYVLPITQPWRTTLEIAGVIARNLKLSQSRRRKKTELKLENFVLTKSNFLWPTTSHPSIATEKRSRRRRFLLTFTAVKYESICLAVCRRY